MVVGDIVDSVPNVADQPRLGCKRMRSESTSPSPIPSPVGLPVSPKVGGDKNDDPKTSTAAAVESSVSLVSLDAIASHYNALADVSGESRAASPVYQLRCFNNWIKTVMISRHVRRGDNVLDLCCGRGGDLTKYARAGISLLYGFDIAESAIAQAKERYTSLRGRKYSSTLKIVDCFNEKIVEHFPPSVQFDVVCAQFCIHYAFQSIESARKLLENVACRLRRGGIFMGTAPNSNWLVKKARSEGKKEFGNSFYSVKFDQLDEFPIYGHKYHFTLHGAVKDCPEYLIHWPSFETLAEEYGLKVLRHNRFHDYYKHNVSSYRDLLLRMDVISIEAPKMSSQEWEIAGLYDVFVFQKVFKRR